jgi:pyruvate dehydrogenase E2 component (dihydrolipoamide acetyltransferase)
MLKLEFKLPDIGEGVKEGEVVSWLVKVGDSVAENQDMVEIMTDKATVTIGAPKAGHVAEIRAKPGDVVPVGGVLIVLEVEGAQSAEQAPKEPPVASAPAKGETALPVSATTVGGPAIAAAMHSRVVDAEESGRDVKAPSYTAQAGGKPLASPAVRKSARELGIDLREVTPSGKSGQVTREDLDRYRAEGAGAKVEDAGTPAPALQMGGAAKEERITIRGVRRRIFENMARSKHNAAHFTYADECDVSALVAVRERTQAIAEKAQLKLTFLPFIVKAVVAALRKHPMLNCLVDDEKMEIIQRRSYDIGIAVATDAGLMVPVVREADRLSMLEIAREIERLAEAARSGKVRKEDLGGSSFTITSLGRLGGLFTTPVINYPEVAILGVHEIKQRPVVKDNQIVVGQVMLLCLSFDHRVIDGHVGAAFAQEVIRYLEQPDALLVDG